MASRFGRAPRVLDEFPEGNPTKLRVKKWIADQLCQLKHIQMSGTANPF